MTDLTSNNRIFNNNPTLPLELSNTLKSMACLAQMQASQMAKPSCLGAPGYSYLWIDRTTAQEVPQPWLKPGCLTQSDLNAILIELEDGVYKGRVVYSFPVTLYCGNDTL